MSTTPSLINIFVALPCEAKPLIHHNQLKRDFTCHYFPVYSNVDRSINLCVSGVGKINMAAAVAFMQQYSPTKTNLNIGIVGSQAHSFGCILIANKITDLTVGKNYYPYFAVIKKVASTQVYTYDVSQSTYPAEGVVDMEASGFFASSTIFLDQECIQVLKIVSDTNETERRAINKKSVEELLEKSAEKIDAVVTAMLNFSKQILKHSVNEIEIKCFFSRWHFTVYQQNHLKNLLRRWQVLQKDIDPMQIGVGASSAKEVLERLEMKLNANYLFRKIY